MIAGAAVLAEECGLQVVTAATSLCLPVPAPEKRLTEKREKRLTLGNI